MMVISGPRLFSSCAVSPNHLLKSRVPAIRGLREFSKMTFEKKKTEEDNQSEKGSSGGKGDQGNKGEQLIVSYWGVKPMKITKDDGTEWKWSCFRVILQNKNFCSALFTLKLVSYCNILVCVCVCGIIMVAMGDV